VQFEFDNRKLRELYEKGRSSKYRFDAGVLKKFFMRIRQIEAAASIHDLRKTPALNFEKLRGSEAMFSLRINDQYRLEVEIDWQNVEKTVGFFHIKEVSKHYEK